ncbi:hypothetical protein ABV409_04815 [Flagellimonas sp. DF-77]|uniref:hypothetical protein n=1 Tax=Flagellimonas algarum TaxID=3230298 RepID=UPI0033994016
MANCSFCKFEHKATDLVCPNCGLPFNASEEQKSKHITGIFRANESLQEVTHSLNRAKWVLFSLGLGMLLILFYSFYKGSLLDDDFMIMAGLSIFISICGFAINDYPIKSVVLGTVFVIALFGYSIYLDPSSLFKGLILKILIFGSLYYAIKSAIEFDKAINNISANR